MKTNRPSATARLVAAATLAGFLWKLEPRATPDAVEMARRGLQRSLAGRLARWTIEFPPARWLSRILERIALPGFVHHIARRKAWIDRWASRSVEEGFRQVVVLGAGLDALGLRLSRPPVNARVIEIDHPATQALKARVLSDMGPARPTLVPADLGHQSLSHLPIDTGAETLVVAEGLLMYMPRERVDQLLDETTEITQARLRVVLTFMESQAGEPPRFGSAGASVGAWLRAMGEPFRWGTTREEFASALTSRGLRILELAGERELAEHWPGAIAEGETLLIAERPARPT